MLNVSFVDASTIQGEKEAIWRIRSVTRRRHGCGDKVMVFGAMLMEIENYLQAQQVLPLLKLVAFPLPLMCLFSFFFKCLLLRFGKLYWNFHGSELWFRWPYLKLSFFIGLSILIECVIDDTWFFTHKVFKNYKKIIKNIYKEHNGTDF